MARIVAPSAPVVPVRRTTSVVCDDLEEVWVGKLDPYFLTKFCMALIRAPVSTWEVFGREVARSEMAFAKATMVGF